MRMPRFSCLFAFLFIALSVSLSAQEYEIEVTANNKTIWVSKLSLPDNMALVDYLLMLPELVDRNADTFLERFDVQLDGKVINDSKDAFLQNTFLREIEKIVISTSPSDTHIKNGICGSVNIVPISIEKGFNGDVTVNASLFSGVMPTANLRYSDGRNFEARMDLNFDIYYPTKLNLQERQAEKYTVTGVDTTRENYLGQMARFYAKWKISDKDVLKLWFWQNYMSDKFSTSSSFTKLEDMSESAGAGWLFSSTETSHDVSSRKQLALNAIVDYTRKLKSGTFSANSDYHSYSNFPGKRDELNMGVKSVTDFKFPERKLSLETSANFSVNSNRSQRNRMLYFSPFVKLNFKGKYVTAILNGRYKGYSRDYCVEGGQPFNKWSHDWTAEADVFWQIKKHHALRLKLIRSAGVASNNLLYPEMVFDKSAQVWRKGNPNLMGPLTNSANIEYITDWSKGLHHIVFNVSTEVNRQTRMIENNILYDSERKVPYVYPVNISYGNVLGLTAMLNYSYGPFYLSFGGNLFHNMKYLSVDKIKASYFNVMIAPSVQLKNGWLLNANFLYNSKLYKENAVLGDCSLFSVCVSKTLKKWTLFASIQDVFDGVSTDVEYLGTEILYKTYDPYMRTFEIGACIHF